MIEITVHAQKLNDLIDSLNPREQVKVIKAGARNEAARWRLHARSLFKSRLDGGKSVARQVRSFIVRRGTAGFGITAKPKSTPRDGKMLAVWFNQGTVERHWMKDFKRKTGRIETMAVMEETEKDLLPGSTAMFREALVKNIIKIARKNAARIS